MRSWLLGRVHSYYFAVLFFTGIIFGIIVSIFSNEMYFSKSFVLVLSLIFGLASLTRFRRVFLVFILFSGLFLGLWRGSVYVNSNHSYEQYSNKSVTVTGVVLDDVTYSPKGDQRFKLKEVSINNNDMAGQLWVSSAGKNEIKRSDTVEVKGYMSDGFGSFSASLVRSDIQIITKNSSNDIGLKARDAFAGATTDTIPEPERSLGLGYLLGLKSSLPESLTKQIQILGLTHVVVASGYNLTILVAFTRRLFVKISKYLSAVTGGVMIAGFILITGFSPSMSRAGLVAGLSLVAWYYGRKIHPIVLLIVAIAVTLMIQPSYIWGDLGWYLSFLAFFGILVLAPLLNHYFWGPDRKPSYLRELIIATFSAQIMTLPIILYSFGTFSLYSLPANILILPIIPFCMLAVFIAGIAGMVLPALANIFALPAVFLLKYCTYIIDTISSASNTQTEVRFGILQIACAYLLIVIFTLALLLKTRHNFLKDKTIVD